MIQSACAPTTSASPSGMSGDNDNMPMDDHFITLAPGASAGVTATPGSMTSSNPEMGHSMERITAPNVQPATIYRAPDAS